MLKSLLKWTLVFVIWSSASIAGPLHDAVKRGDVVQLEQLIEAGEDLSLQDNLVGTFDQKNAPLHVAAGVDSVEIARLLIEAGADIEATSTWGGGPLMVAANGNAAGTVELLVISGANIDAKLPSGRTALTMAVQGNGAEAVKKLLELGADINGAPETKPVHPTTPLAYAIANKSDEIADILREAGASE